MVCRQQHPLEGQLLCPRTAGILPSALWLTIRVPVAIALHAIGDVVDLGKAGLRQQIAGDAAAAARAAGDHG